MDFQKVNQTAEKKRCALSFLEGNQPLPTFFNLHDIVPKKCKRKEHFQLCIYYFYLLVFSSLLSYFPSIDTVSI